VRLAALALLLAASVAALLAADRLTGLFFGPVPRWPVLTPESSVRYKTVEFDIVAQANRFGFRGDKSTIRTGQIVAIGDSYTFGWGVTLPTLGRKSSHLHDPPRSDRRVVSMAPWNYPLMLAACP
jgi:hypothetical protein